MRFLCLHGMGTNSAVFEAQLAPIVANLDTSHEFVFIDGLTECDAAEGVKEIFPGPFYCYYRQPTLDQLQEAFDLIYDVVDEEGPFDGIIGFSQGAALASSLLLDHQKNNPRGQPLFRVAVFLCGSLPFDLDSIDSPEDYQAVISPETGLVRIQDVITSAFVESSKTSGFVNGSYPGDSFLRRHHAKKTKTRINVPTVHIVGEDDPYLPQGRALVDLCVGEKVVVTHDLGHMLPRDSNFSQKAASAAENMISKAIFQS
ncbi:hypothetical protein SCUP234_09186 [Seiridium cupressi]